MKRIHHKRGTKWPNRQNDWVDINQLTSTILYHWPPQCWHDEHKCLEASGEKMSHHPDSDQVIDLDHQEEGGIIMSWDRGNICRNQVLLIVGLMNFIFLNFFLWTLGREEQNYSKTQVHNFCPNTFKWDVPKTMMFVLNLSWMCFREDQGKLKWLDQ